jgi:uncharacterized protein
MIAILIVLVVSWLLLWFYNKKNLTALGLTPTKKRVIDLLVGLFVSAIICAVYFLSIITISKSSLTLNNKFTTLAFFGSLWWMLKSVLLEEFIFRGALLYIGIQKFGIRLACILSSVAFGIYHWFSYNVIGNPVQMILVFFITAIGGLMFAYAFALTKSMYLPVALHLGWNMATVVVFSQGPLGQQVFIIGNEHKLNEGLSLVFFLFQALALPGFTYWYLSRQRTTTNKAYHATAV